MNKIGKLFIIGLSLSLVTGCGCSKDKDNKDKDNKEPESVITENTNEEVIKDQSLEVFTFTNTSLVYKDGTSTLETVVTNTSAETQYLVEFKILVKDEAGNEIVTLTGFVGDNIEANSSKVITSSYGDDLTKAASIEYSIIR